MGGGGAFPLFIPSSVRGQVFRWIGHEDNIRYSVLILTRVRPRCTVSGDRRGLGPTEPDGQAQCKMLGR